MGSTTHIVDEAGQVQNRYEYDAWGNITAQEEAVPNRFKFTGQQLDPITQQYYLRARFYNPVITRFTQEDTYRGDGLNLYAYCANNPVYYVDPSGNFVQCVKDAYDKAIREGQSREKAYQLALAQANQTGRSKKDAYLAAKEVYNADITGKELGPKLPEITDKSLTREQWKDEHRSARETRNEVQKVMQQYQALLNQTDPITKGNTPRKHGSLVHKSVAAQMANWLKTQNFQHIEVNLETSYHEGDAGKRGKRGSTYAKPDLVIRDPARNQYYIGDIKTGNDTYGKTQMAKNQGHVLGGNVSTTAKQAEPDATHWQFKPGERAPTERRF